MKSYVYIFKILNKEATTSNERRKSFDFKKAVLKRTFGFPGIFGKVTPILHFHLTPPSLLLELKKNDFKGNRLNHSNFGMKGKIRGGYGPNHKAKFNKNFTAFVVCKSKFSQLLFGLSANPF